MGRIATAFRQTLLRGCVAWLLALLYVVPVVFLFFLFPLARHAASSSPTVASILVPFGIGTLLLLVLPLLVGAWWVERRKRKLDEVFGSLGLEGQPFALQFRQYHGVGAGRQVAAFFARGPRLTLEVSTAVATRLGIAAEAGDTGVLAALAGKRPLSFASPDFRGLQVFAAEEEWARRLLGHPAVPGLLARLLRFPGTWARRQVVLRPGTFALQLHLTTALFGWELTSAMVREWLDALGVLAGCAESVPPPSRPEPVGDAERVLAEVRRPGPSINGPLLALAGVVATPVVVLGIGLAVSAARGKPLHLPSFSVLGPRPTALPAPTPPPEPDVASLLDGVEELRRALAAGPIGAGELAGRIGPVRTESRQSIQVVPKEARFSTGVVLRDVGSGEATQVILILAAPGSVRLATLAARWGGAAPPTGHPVPTSWLPEPVEGDAFTCRVVASLSSSGDGVVESIGLSREPP